MADERIPGPYWVSVQADREHHVCGRGGKVIRRYPAGMAAAAYQDCRKLQKGYTAYEKRLHDEAPAMAEALRYVTDHLVSELGELADEDGTPDDQLGPWLGQEYAKQVINARLRIRQARSILARIGEA